MRMGGFSYLTQQRLPPVTHTDALFADQSQSILDNLVTLLGQNPAWHWTQNAVIRNTSGFAEYRRTLRTMSANWGNSESIYSLGVLPPVPSRPGELHPEPLTDPDLILSHHPARATVRRLPPSVACQVPPVAG